MVNVFMPDLSFLSSIYFTRIRVVFEAVELIVLPVYKGSTFRGCLGEALRSGVCEYKGGECDQCPQRYSCSFSQLFNSYVEPQHPHRRKYTKSPHPYIINPLLNDQTEFKPGDTFGFELTLIGTAGEHLPLLLHVFERMGSTGIGKGRGRFKPVQVMMLNSGLEYEPLPYFGKADMISLAVITSSGAEKRITLLFENPLRVMEHGKLLLSPPSFEFLIERLVLRMGLLAHFHCSAPWSESEWGLSVKPTGIQIAEANILEVDWRRYSGTQDTTMNFDGIVGDITYEGEGINDWIMLLTLGSWLHVGSTATFGLGKYSIMPG
jgi:hypothetical protein